MKLIQIDACTHRRAISQALMAALLRLSWSRQLVCTFLKLNGQWNNHARRVLGQRFACWIKIAFSRKTSVPLAILNSLDHQGGSKGGFSGFTSAAYTSGGTCSPTEVHHAQMVRQIIDARLKRWRQSDLNRSSLIFLCNSVQPACGRCETNGSVALHSRYVIRLGHASHTNTIQRLARL